MIVPFHSLPDNARIWIFQSNRALQPADIEYIHQACSHFLNNWQTHGSEICAGFDIRYNHFLIIGADTEIHNTSGCSIDKLHNLIQNIGQNLSVDFFNRDLVIFYTMDHRVLPLSITAQLHSLENIDLQGIKYFHNVISEKKALEKEWLRPVEGSWLQRKILKKAIT